MEGKRRLRPGAGKVAFMARIDSIKAKIEAYYTMAEVYDEYKDVLPIGYGQFVNYVNEHVKGKEKRKNLIEEKKAERKGVVRYEKKKSFMDIQNEEISDEDVFK